MNYSHRFSSIFISTLIFFLSVPSFALAFEKEINSLATAMAGDIVNADKKIIAVVDFTDLQGNVTELGRFLAEEFSVALAGADKGFEVVDRTYLKSIIVEHKLSATGLIDPKTARKLGQIAGVEALITGTITPFGDSVRLSAKILDTATARVIGGSRGNIAKTKAIEELLARGIETSQPFKQTASPSAYVPSAGSQKSKKIGPMIVTIERIIVSSKDQISVVLDFFNQSDKKFEITRIKTKPNLADEKGSVFRYKEGLPTFSYRGLTLNPKSKNDVILRFYHPNKKITIEDIGFNFTFDLNFRLYNSISKDKMDYTVSFLEIKAQRPR